MHAYDAYGCLVHLRNGLIEAYDQDEDRTYLEPAAIDQLHLVVAHAAVASARPLTCPRLLRDELDFSLADLAAYMGRSAEALAHYEDRKGVKLPDSVDRALRALWRDLMGPCPRTLEEADGDSRVGVKSASDRIVMEWRPAGGWQIAEMQRAVMVRKIRHHKTVDVRAA